MPQKPLDAIISRRNKFVTVALRCQDCNYVIKITKFSETMPAFMLREYIQRQNDTAPIWHFCSALPNRGELAVNSSTNPSLY